MMDEPRKIKEALSFANTMSGWSGAAIAIAAAGAFIGYLVYKDWMNAKNITELIIIQTQADKEFLEYAKGQGAQNSVALKLATDAIETNTEVLKQLKKEEVRR